MRRAPSSFLGCRRGYVLIYVSIALVTFTGICALAVDWGRVQLAKTELRRTCDAAARYAVTGISDGTTLAKAKWIGTQNLVDGRTIAFTAADVETGTWDPAALQFTPGTVPANAVRVTARRRVPGVFEQVAGPSSTQFVVQAIARFNVIGYGVVGLNRISMKGNTSTSYWSANGAAAPGFGNIGSNGSITLGGGSSIDGNAYYGPGGSVSGGTISGTTAQLSAPLSFPPGDAGSATFFNNDWLIPSWAYSGNGNLTLSSTNR